MHPLFRAIGVLAADIPAAKLCADGLFGGRTPDPPAVSAPVSMPDLQDPQLLAAKKRSDLAKSALSGRQSTILSGGTDDYSNSKLGTP